jgi:hypothetical protein
MIGITRGLSTVIGAGIAGFLIWLASTIGTETSGEYWLTYGLVAAAGLTMALSQLLGGWTKWGWPTLSGGVFLLGFLPVLLVGGWVLLARQPADFFNTSNWSRDLGVMGAVGGLGEFLAAVAFGIGLTLGFTFDTSGPRRDAVVDEHDEADGAHRVEQPTRRRRFGGRRGAETTTVADDAPTARHGAAGERVGASDEPLSAERSRSADDVVRDDDPGARRTVASDRERTDRP